MRHWAAVPAGALGIDGSRFYFTNWGIFADGQGFAKFLWAFGALAFITGITGTKLGLPAYWAWMSFVYAVSSLIGYGALSLVYLLVVTPMALLAKALGRDKLQLRSAFAPSYWRELPKQPHRPEHQF